MIALQQEQTPILQAAAGLESLLHERNRTGAIALLAGRHAEQDKGDGRAGLIPDLAICGQGLLPQVFRLLVLSLIERMPGQLDVDVGGAPPILHLLPQCQRLLQQLRCFAHALPWRADLERAPPQLGERARGDVGILQCASQSQRVLDHDTCALCVSLP